MLKTLITFAAVLAISASVAGRPTPTDSTTLTTKAAPTVTPVRSTHLTRGSPFQFPLLNGFPNPDQTQLSSIETAAHGTFPNSPAPASLHPESETSLALIAFNELFEVAFFTELLENITCSKPGYTSSEIRNREEVLAILHAVKAQEEMHALAALSAFKKFTGKTVEPCKYVFPVSNFHDAITLASTFTDVVLGTLPEIQGIFAANNDGALIPQLGSIIGQEGEQNGFYRRLLKKIPSALPFLTGGARGFAFNAILQNFIAPGECTSAELLIARGLRQFGVLKVSMANVTRNDTSAEFSLQPARPIGNATQEAHDIHEIFQKTEGKFLTYINQQNLPFSVPMNITDHSDSGTIKFSASFPGETHDLNGLTIAAVTNGSGPLNTPADVASATLYGPALIEVA